MRHLFIRRSLAMVAVWLTFWQSAVAADEFERPPIEYSRAVPDNAISKLQARLDSGDVQLKYERHFGYLRSLLDALRVPVDSQMLVFSKTSLQRERISPQSPRAIYFNDDVYVGFCQSGAVMEVSVADRKLGAAFYTLDQKETDRPQFVRQTDNCLVCHSSSRTEGVPGHLVRSLFTDAGGLPILSAGSYTVDHTTPLEQRWGGWYVTGTHGSQSHLGNLVIRGKEVPQPFDNALGQNVTRLDDRLDVDNYLSPHSDIVALLVLEHQTLVHNRIAKANFETRQALHYEAALMRALKEPSDKHFDSTIRRIQQAGDDLVAALLFVDEAKLTAPIHGTSSFAERFAAGGPNDSRGRSLRDLDLQSRLFKYPCSYLIYSPAFDELPDEMRDYVWQRLWKVLARGEDGGKFRHLSAGDRQHVLEIIHDTKPNLPSNWRLAGLSGIDTK